MKYAHLIWKNLWRRKARTFFTLLSILAGIRSADSGEIHLPQGVDETHDLVGQLPPRLRRTIAIFTWVVVAMNAVAWLRQIGMQAIEVDFPGCRPSRAGISISTSRSPAATAWLSSTSTRATTPSIWGLMMTVSAFT